ncbi:SGNH/GDSL hydrolase family protein [Neobacillus vireti]|uniref:SGNH/GDSL hydrolase family protein n=1 Tax=Neobacillus vireti TaxID=220686 RepID=UPI003000ADE5
MKYLLTALWAFICIGILAYSHIHWNQQTTARADDIPTTTLDQESVSAENESNVLEEQSNDVNIDKYIMLAANWPETAKQSLKQAIENKKPFKILFVGSAVNQWEKQVTQSLSDSFSSEHVITSTFSYDLTSKEIVDQGKQLEVAAEKAQLIVIEPFLLNDNGKVSIGNTLNNLTKMIETVKAKNPETTIILQPSYPLYKAKHYPKQVTALKAYAFENQLTFLDHWTQWPASNDPELNNYLNGKSGPNELGYQVWAQFLVEYFVNK